MSTLADTAVRTRIIQRLESIRSDSPRKWGEMNAHEMLCHLADSFKVCMGRKQVSMATGLLQRTLVKWIALHVPAPWPKGVKTRPEVMQRVGGTKPVEFDRDRSDLIQLIEQFVSPKCTRTPHPFFGDMKEAEWMRWGYLHVDHHLRQFGV